MRRFSSAGLPGFVWLHTPPARADRGSLLFRVRHMRTWAFCALRAPGLAVLNNAFIYLVSHLPQDRTLGSFAALPRLRFGFLPPHHYACAYFLFIHATCTFLHWVLLRAYVPTRNGTHWTTFSFAWTAMDLSRFTAVYSLLRTRLHRANTFLRHTPVLAAGPLCHRLHTPLPFRSFVSRAPPPGCRHPFLRRTFTCCLIFLTAVLTFLVWFVDLPIFIYTTAFSRTSGTFGLLIHACLPAHARRFCGVLTWFLPFTAPPPPLHTVFCSLCATYCRAWTCYSPRGLSLRTQDSPDAFLIFVL